MWSQFKHTEFNDYCLDDVPWQIGLYDEDRDVFKCSTEPQQAWLRLQTYSACFEMLRSVEANINTYQRFLLHCAGYDTYMWGLSESEFILSIVLGKPLTDNKLYCRESMQAHICIWQNRFHNISWDLRSCWWKSEYYNPKAAQRIGNEIMSKSSYF